MPNRYDGVRALATTDLTVRGAGIFGLCIGWDAIRRGAKVRVIDPRGPGGGASGGPVGALAPHVPEAWNEIKAFQFACLIGARQYWPAVEAESGIATGYRRSGRLQPLSNDRAVARAKERAQTAAEYWQDLARWEVTSDAGDFAPVSPTGLWVSDTLSAQIDPPRAIAALAAAIAGNGGEIVTEGRDEGAVVEATGWEGLRDISEALGRDIGGGVKGQAAMFEAAPGDIPQLYADGLHVVTHGPGRVAIGSTSEREFSAADTTDAQLDEVIARARSAVPWLRDAAVSHRWAGVRPRATSRNPVVGSWPGRTGHFIANGGFKIGFALAPGLGRLAVDLALEGKDGVPNAFRLPD